MKRIILGLVFAVVSLVAESDWPFVCERSDIAFIKDDRYLVVNFSSHGDYPLIQADSKSIQIDRKNKIIKVWTLWLAAEQGRINTIKREGQRNDFNNYGYHKYLQIINYETMQTKFLTISQHNCNGSAIYSNNFQDNDWMNIVPESVMERIVEELVRRYDL